MWYTYHMNKVDIEAKQAVLQSKFDELQKQRTDINEELLRLQGEYRALSSLLSELEETPSVKVKGEK